MNSRTIAFLVALPLPCGVAFAATADPPTENQLARLLDLLERGGAAVVVLELVAGIAALACLVAVVFVFTTAVQAVPRAARPLADAVATLRGGSTQREERLRRENAELSRKVDLLEAQVSSLDHRGEEMSRVIAALVDQLAVFGIDVTPLRAMTTHPSIDLEIDRASAA